MSANKRIETFASKIRGKRVAVLGVGISNRPLIRFLHHYGALITAFDSLEKDDPVLSQTIESFESEKINVLWSVGKRYLDKIENEYFDYIFRTPKMRPDNPLIVAAVKRGSILTSEMEVFMALCPATVFGITGSDGKTTTTTLIAKILEKAGYNVFLGGNIGTPLLDKIASITEDDMVVLELSSFQLLTMKTSPDIAIVTNITPNHLDFHNSYSEYINAKRNIYRYQNAMGTLVLNAENRITNKMKIGRRGKLSMFSSSDFSNKRKTPNGLIGYSYIKGGVLKYSIGNVETEIMSVDDILIPGRHNVENMSAAVCATFPFVCPNDIRDVAMTFPGVEHRIELVRTVKGIRFFNSSIDTSPNRTIHTMNALFDRGDQGVLIAGGEDKRCIYDGLGTAISKVCNRVVLFGNNANIVRKAIIDETADEEVEIYDSVSLQDAVTMAFSLAKAGEIVIMSPTGTSYDHYRHFEERGNLFKKIVRELDE